jgi:hypothetical protein
MIGRERTHIPAGFSFQASTPEGMVVLTIPPAADAKTSDSLDAVDLALQLQTCETMVQAFEQWLNVPLALTPLGTGQAPRGGALSVLSDGRLSPAGVHLRLPPGLLLQAAPPPSALLALRWSTLHCEAELSTYGAPPGSRNELLKGCLLIPDSFATPWRVKLADPLGGLMLHARCAVSGLVLSEWEGAGRWAPPRSDVWRVVLSHPVAVPLPMALGWQAGQVTMALQAARLLGPGEDAVWAQGLVCPAWAGAALVIQVPAPLGST